MVPWSIQSKTEMTKVFYISDGVWFDLVVKSMLIIAEAQKDILNDCTVDSGMGEVS